MDKIEILKELEAARKQIEVLARKVNVYELQYKNHGKMHICMPNYRGTMESQAYESLMSLWHTMGVRRREFNFSNYQGTVVSQARQMCVDTALTDPDCEYIVFIDDDMVYTPEDFLRLEIEMFDKDLDYVAALGFSNSIPTKPCVFGKYPGLHPQDESKTWWHIVTDYPKNQLFKCYATGMGMTFIRKRMLDKMRRKENGEVDPGYQHFVHKTIPNEDVAFGVKAQEQGFELWCDSRVKIGHISKDRPIISEETYYALGDAIETAGDVERLKFKPGTIDLVKMNGKQPKREIIYPEVVL